MKNVLVTLSHNENGNETFICSDFDDVMQNPTVVQYIKNWVAEYKDFDPSVTFLNLEQIPMMSEFFRQKGI